MFRSVPLLAMTTLREAVRAKLTGVIIAFSCFCLILSTVAASLTLGWPIRIVADIALSGMNFALAAIAITVGITSTAREIDRRTALYVLAKPIPRATLVVGKTAGIALATTAIFIPLSVLIAGLLAAFSHEGGIYYPVGSYLGVVGLIWFRAIVLGVIAVVTASCFAPTIAAIVCITIGIGGYFAADTRALLGQYGGTNAIIGDVIYYLFPDFAALDGLANLVHGNAVFTPATLTAGVQAGIYALFILLLGCTLFQRREIA